jgi:hypothetical protein
VGSVLLSCGVSAAFVWLRGAQAGSPVEKQEKKHGVEQAKPKEADKSAAPEPTTLASASGSACASAFGTECATLSSEKPAALPRAVFALRLPVEKSAIPRSYTGGVMQDRGCGRSCFHAVERLR